MARKNQENVTGKIILWFRRRKSLPLFVGGAVEDPVSMKHPANSNNGDFIYPIVSKKSLLDSCVVAGFGTVDEGFIGFHTAWQVPGHCTTHSPDQIP